MSGSAGVPALPFPQEMKTQGEMMLYANYHTHTYRCGHGSTEPDEAYVLAAIEAGVKILGFTDHCPWPYSESFYKRGVRMHMSELPEYIASIRGLAEKYKDSIKIYVGLECEFFEEYYEYIEWTTFCSASTGEDRKRSGRSVLPTQSRRSSFSGLPKTRSGA